MPQNPTPQDYVDAGFRVLRIHPTEKKPLEGGFGKDSPHFTCPAEDFGPNERIALLLGPCEFVGEIVDPDNDVYQPAGFLICLDLDHGLPVDDIEAHTGPLPDTLTSKGGAHMYYRVAPSEARDQLRQWTNVLKADDPKMGALDLKWLGGYAIEPGNVPGGWDDGGFDPERIAVLPDKAVQAFVALKSRPASAPRKTTFEVDPDADYAASAVDALASIWPAAGNHFDAALALGGVLSASALSEPLAMCFCEAVFYLAKCDRLRQVEVSFQNARSGADVEIKGWPSLLALLKPDPAALKTFTDGVPGLRREPGLSPAMVLKAEIMTDPDFCAPVIPIRPDGEGLEAGDAVSVAADIMRRKLPGAVFAEGQLWAKPSDGFVWETVGEPQVSRWTQEYSQASYGTDSKGKPKRLQVGLNFIKSVWGCIAAQLDEPDFFADVPARVVFENGVLDVSTGELTPATSAERIRSALPFEYHADQLTRHPPAQWAEFLAGQWGGDKDSIALLHQMLGYLLSGRMEQEKMFVMLGPPRCGKGTIIKLLEAIMGESCGAFKIATLDEKFSMSSMRGKSVLVDPDVRKSKSAFSDSGVIAERLLSITSGDKQSIRLVGGSSVDAVLQGRILVAANPPFELKDEGGALATRICVLNFKKSFLGEEDRGLLGRLKAEIPSIVALALGGLRHLDKLGKFTEPEASKVVKDEIKSAQDPMNEFWEDFCETCGTDEPAPAVSDVYQKVCRWRESSGLRPFSKRALGGFFAGKGIHSDKIRRDGTQVRVYKGLRLKS